MSYIYGGVHKLTFTSEPYGQKNLVDLQIYIDSLKLSSRVHFMGFQEDSRDLFKSCIFSDYIVLPYMEVGESASASFYSAIEFCNYVFATRNCCFEELSIFFKELCLSNGFFQFDMANAMELAEKIRGLPDKEMILKNRIAFLQNYSITENVKKIFNL